MWAGVPSCYLELLDKAQKRICRTVGPSLATSLQPLAHRRNVTSLTLFYSYYFGRCLSELAQLVPFPFSRGRSTCYSARCHDFFVAIARCYKDVYVNNFFPNTAEILSYRMLSCNLWSNWLNSSVDRYLLTVKVLGECPSGLRHCSKIWKVPGSNRTRCSPGPRDPTHRYKAPGDIRV